MNQNTSQAREIIIKTGYSAISYDNLNIRPGTMELGQGLLDAKHIFADDVYERRKVGCQPEIFAKCVRGTNIHNQLYNISLELDSDRKIVRALCSCTAGASPCKHIAAVILLCTLI